MKSLFFILFFVVFAYPVFAGELKLVNGKFDQSQKITVTVMDEKGKIQKVTKKIPIHYMYTKTPKKEKKIPVSIGKKVKNNSYAFIISSETVSACSTTTVRYIIDRSGKKIFNTTETDTTTSITNNELYVVKKDGKTF